MEEVYLRHCKTLVNLRRYSIDALFVVAFVTSLIQVSMIHKSCLSHYRQRLNYRNTNTLGPRWLKLGDISANFIIIIFLIGNVDKDNPYKSSGWSLILMRQINPTMQIFCLPTYLNIRSPATHIYHPGRHPASSPLEPDKAPAKRRASASRSHCSWSWETRKVPVKELAFSRDASLDVSQNLL